MVKPGYQHGLVLGKFYPPHEGHHCLVNAAADACRQVTVLVCASSVESIPLPLRIHWMRQIHQQQHISIVGLLDDLPVDFNDAALWDAHMVLIRQTLEQQLGPAIDAVFTSEDYGEELSRRLGARHISVDPSRAAIPISGTQIRQDPIAHWSYLSAPVKTYFAKRVVVLGAESTGTTTLARALATHYAARGGIWETTQYVPEYARTYCAQKFAALCGHAEQTGAKPPRIEDMPWTSSEFTEIATRQLAAEDHAAGIGSPLLICDTDALATLIWHERYLAWHSSEVESIVTKAGQRFWILTDCAAVPFEQDGTRDGEHLREWMTRRFQDELRRRGLPHLLVTGPPEVRLRQAAAAIDGLLLQGWRFASPL